MRLSNDRNWGAKLPWVLFDKQVITDEQAAVLLDVPLRSYRRWKAAGDVGWLDRDTKARLSNLIGIHKALRYMFSELEQVYAWIGKPTADGSSGSYPADPALALRVMDFLNRSAGGDSFSALAKRGGVPVSIVNDRNTR